MWQWDEGATGLALARLAECREKTPSHSPPVPLWSSENPSPPNLFPLITCESFQSDETLVAMGCLAGDFLPDTVTFSWTYKNDSEVSRQNVKYFPSVLREGKYVATSQVFLPSVDVLQGSEDYLTCKVKHTKGNKSVHVPLPGESRALLPRRGGQGEARGLTPGSLPAAAVELPPNVTVFIPPRDAFSGNGQRTSQLLCQARGFSPKQISVSWFRDGKPLASGIDTGKVEADGKVSGTVTYRVLSTLTITESAWLSQSVFTCQVEHSGVTSERNVSSVCTSSECLAPGRPLGRGVPHVRGRPLRPATPRALASRSGQGLGGRGPAFLSRRPLGLRTAQRSCALW